MLIVIVTICPGGFFQVDFLPKPLIVRQNVIGLGFFLVLPRPCCGSFTSPFRRHCIRSSCLAAPMAGRPCGLACFMSFVKLVSYPPLPYENKADTNPAGSQGVRKAGSLLSWCSLRPCLCFPP